jgi:hypothetical protein
MDDIWEAAEAGDVGEVERLMGGGPGPAQRRGWQWLDALDVGLLDGPRGGGAVAARPGGGHQRPE